LAFSIILDVSSKIQRNCLYIIHVGPLPSSLYQRSSVYRKIHCDVNARHGCTSGILCTWGMRMRSRNDNNAAVLGSAGGLEERVHANMLREACDGTHCATRVISSRYLSWNFL